MNNFAVVSTICHENNMNTSTLRYVLLLNNSDIFIYVQLGNIYIESKKIDCSWYLPGDSEAVLRKIRYIAYPFPKQISISVYDGYVEMPKLGQGTR